jgi:hypothetical protein
MSDPYTKNTPADVREVTSRISSAVGRTTDGANLWDNGFDWRARHETHEYTDEMGIPRQVQVPVTGTAHQMNGTRDREVASERFSAHVLQQVDKAIEAGTLDKNKPLTINLVGFSHGGNVAILASDEISEGLKRRGIDSAIHLTTLSTPAYTWGPENPDTARNAVQADGVKFAHTHFSTPGDGVIRLAAGRANYDTEVTRNYNFPNAPFGLDGIANHGAVQNVPGMMDGAAEVMRQRFNGLAPAQRRADAGAEIQVAGITPATPGSGNLDWQAFNTNPMVQQASAALHRVVPEVPQENLNPSMVASVAGVAAENRFSAIKDVAFSQNGQTAFVTDRDKNDPSARVAPVDMALGNKQAEDVVQKYAVALNNAQTQQVASQDQDQQRKQNAPSVA